MSIEGTLRSTDISESVDDYDQGSKQISNSTDASEQSGTRSSGSENLGKSTQNNNKSEYVNTGCIINFKVKIRGGYPTLPGAC
jgi:hypothetical protein